MPAPVHVIDAPAASDVAGQTGTTPLSSVTATR